MLTLEKVIAAAMRHQEVAESLGEALTSDLVVANPHMREIMKFVYAFVRQHRSLPKHGDVELWVSTLVDTQRHNVVDALSRITVQDTRDLTPAYLNEYAITELRTAATRTAVSRLAASQITDPSMLVTLADEIKRIEGVSLSDLASIREPERWVRADSHDEVVSTGIVTLDEAIGGGYPKSELSLIFADSGMGKTTVLCNNGVGAATRGGNALHITMELSKARTLQRYYRRIAEADRAFFSAHEDQVLSRVHHWMRFAKGNIHVYEARAYEMTVEQLAVLVDRFVQTYGPLDELIVDYIDLFAPSKDIRAKSTADQLAHTSHRLRAIGLDHNLAVVSASQSVRKANGAKSLKMSDMSDSYGKVRAVGVLLGFVQTEDEARLNQGRFCPLKLRDSGGKGREVPVYINFDLMRVSALDHPDTVRVMRACGHLPGQQIASTVKP